MIFHNDSSLQRLMLLDYTKSYRHSTTLIHYYQHSISHCVIQDNTRLTPMHNPHTHMHMHIHYQYQIRPVGQNTWWKTSHSHSYTVSLIQSFTHHSSIITMRGSILIEWDDVVYEWDIEKHCVSLVDVMSLTKCWSDAERSENVRSVTWWLWCCCQCYCCWWWLSVIVW